MIALNFIVSASINKCHLSSLETQVYIILAEKFIEYMMMNKKDKEELPKSTKALKDIHTLFCRSLFLTKS